MSPLATINASMMALRLTVKKWTPIVLSNAALHDEEIPRSFTEGLTEYEDIELPARKRLNVTKRVPDIPPNIKFPKMAKKIGLMQGREDVHNTLLHKQFGIIALRGGRLKVKHFEQIRNTTFRHLDKEKQFAIYRVEMPWQPLFRKGIGHKMGGGKGGIAEYCTPVRPDQVIIEVGGLCSYFEVETWLTHLANRMPFKSMAVSQEIMERRAENYAHIEKLNDNKWNLEYIFKNQMGSSKRWIRRQDFFHFGKYY
ncbi:unnamed protein product [Bemisia tabaci]|uniref:Large ribosomal subunit protein uL16m n=1 Tax=Bemisia tabaci TaxID=7038 RepID=A0A9P0F786_BEMTA|nr:unnamed protein product [Bemisia tabaci]